MKQSDDEQHLRLLSIFHYVVAGLTALIACFPIFHFGMGLMVFTASLLSLTQGQGFDAIPAAFFGLIFMGVGGGFILIGWAFAACIALAGRFLATRKRYTFCLVMAGIECAFTPFGTVLGVFTIIVLMRPSVKELFMSQTVEAAG